MSTAVISTPFYVSGFGVYPAFKPAPPSSLVVHQGFTAVAQLVDANLFAVPTENITVMLLDEDTGMGSPSNVPLIGTTLVSALSGTAEFGTLKIPNPGRYKLRLHSEGLRFDSELITVSSGPPHSLTITALPSRVYAATALRPSPEVTVVDVYGNVVSDYTGNINAVIMNNLTSVIVQAFEPIATVQGRHSLEDIVPASVGNAFYMRVQTSDTYRAASISLTITTTVFRVDAGSLAAISVSIQPRDGIVRKPLSRQPVVRALDAAGNVLTAFTGIITAFLNASVPGGVGLTGGVSVQAVNGVATFTSLGVNATGRGVVIGFQTAENCGRLTYALPVHVTNETVYIRVFKAAAQTRGGAPFLQQPQIGLYDASNFLVTGENSIAVSAYICEGAAGQRLKGNTTVQADAGLVKYTDLAIDIIGPYTICFTSSGMNVVNISVTITVLTPAAIVISRQPILVRAGMLFETSPLIEVRDAGGNVFTLPVQLNATLLHSGIFIFSAFHYLCVCTCVHVRWGWMRVYAACAADRDTSSFRYTVLFTFCVCVCVCVRVCM